ncbi:MAG: AbrB/MazE/SpoVT family DNA-binding domain-containing protein [Candidatus Methylomirabilis sp.]
MGVVDTIRLGRKGQLSIPKAILRKLGLEGDTLMVVDTTPDGGILLRPAGVYPIEIYSDRRLREFRTEDRMTAREATWVRKRTRRPS